jgi:hypothetical protein
MPWPTNDVIGSPLTKALGPIAAKLAGNVNPSQLAEALGPLAAQFANGKLQAGQLTKALGPLAAQLGNPQLVQMAKEAYDNIQKNPDGALAKAFKSLVAKKTDQTKAPGCAAGSCPLKPTATWAPSQNKPVTMQRPVQVLERQQEQWSNGSGSPHKVAQQAMRSAKQTLLSDPRVARAEQTWQTDAGVPRVVQNAKQAWQTDARVPRVVQNAKQAWQTDARVPRVVQNVKQWGESAIDRNSPREELGANGGWIGIGGGCPLKAAQHKVDYFRPREAAKANGWGGGCPLAQKAYQAAELSPCARRAGAQGGGCPLAQKAYQAAEQSPCALRAARAKMQSALQSPCALRAAERSAANRSDARECGVQSAWLNRQGASSGSRCGWGKWAAAQQDLPPTKEGAKGVFGIEEYTDDQVEWIPQSYNYVQPAASPQCSLGSYASCQQSEVEYAPQSYAALY